MVERDVSQGVAQPLLQAEPPAYGLAKAGGLERVESLERALTARASQPVLGRVKLPLRLGRAGRPARPPDREGPHRQGPLPRRGAGTGRGQGGPLCAANPSTCTPDGTVVFELAELTLEPGETLTGLDLELLDDLGAPLSQLDGQTVLSTVPGLTLRATAHLEGGSEPTRLLQVPVAVAVTQGSDGTLDSAGHACPEQRLTTGAAFDYLVGNRVPVGWWNQTPCHRARVCSRPGRARFDPGRGTC